MTKRRFFALVFLIFLLISVLCFIACSPKGSTDNKNEEDFEEVISNENYIPDEQGSIGLNYELLDNGNYKVSIGSCTDENIVIPSLHNQKLVEKVSNNGFEDKDFIKNVIIGYGVKEIGNSSFRSCDKLSTIVLPNSIQSVGNSAFMNCKSIISIKIPYGVNKLSGWLFYGCESLKSVELPEGIQVIEGEAFSYCHSLKSIVIPKSVTSIEDAVFEQSGIVSIVIPDNVQNIGNECFINCNSLVSVTIGKNVSYIGMEAFNNCHKLVEIINKSAMHINKGEQDNHFLGYYALTIHNNESKIKTKDDFLFIEHSGTNFLIGYVGSSTSLNFPNDYNGQTYEIYQYAFYKCDWLVEVKFSPNIKTIGQYAFRECPSLSAVKLVDGINTIEHGAFMICNSLTSIYIPSSVSIIGSYAFSWDYGIIANINCETASKPIGWDNQWYTGQCSIKWSK